MAIDISKDLNITLLPRDIATPTINGTYDVGNPGGTYIPGKDFSPTDNVSTGTTAQLNLSIAFDSISNQLYNLDKVYIQSVDDPRTNGTGNIPGRWINQDPNPTNITDDGQNTIIPGYNSTMSSIVFDATANIKSDSTLTTGITVTLPPFGFWWKSKIMPKIQVVAEKDGITKTSAPLELSTILLSTAGILSSTLAYGGDITYNNIPGQLGFNDPISISTIKQNVTDITNIYDTPDYSLITYTLNYTATVNGNSIPLTTSNFSLLNISGGTLQSLSYAGGILTVIIEKIPSAFVGFRINAFIPFDATGMTQATVGINGVWNVTPPLITNFINQYLFSQQANGTLNRTVKVNIGGEPPAKQPYIQESIYGSLSGGNVISALGIKNYSCFSSLNSTFIRMIDSEIAKFGSNLNPSYTFFDIISGTTITKPIPSDSYIIRYGHYNFSGNYDPNLIAQSILNGTIPMQTYADIIASGKTPNLAAITLTKDLFAGYNVDYSQTINFQFIGNMDILSQSEFATLYNSNPKDSYPTNIYSYIALTTCYNSVAEGYAAIGSLMASVDSLQLRNGAVDLDLGTTNLEQPISVARFTTTSFVRAYLPFTTIDANVQYIITNNDGIPINTVTDYTQIYRILIRWSSQGGSDNANTHIPAGTKLTITLPSPLLPYLFLSGLPYIEVSLNGGIIAINITEYNLSGNQLSITVPVDLDMQPDNIYIPIKFLTPSTDLTNTFLSLSFSQPLVYTQDPNSLIYGFTTDSLMYRVNTVTTAFTLKGAQLDSTGLSVTPQIYERNEAVTYIATVYNQSYAPDSDYYMSMTVPTNQYNPVETSNNSLQAYITGVNPTNPNTVLYFQTANNVTAQDILVMKTLNSPLVPNLKQYFNTVITNTWILFTGQVLPSNIVMMVGYTPKVPQNSLVRIDYNVKVQIPSGDNTLYKNDAVFNYYSGGAILESQSNMVTIHNRIAEAIPIVKLPPVQIHPLKNGTPVGFQTSFAVPLDSLIFQAFTLTDILHPSLTLDSVNTKVIAYPNTPVPFNVTIDAVTNTMKLSIQNTPQISGKTLIVDIATTVTDTTLIPIDPVYQLPLFYNTLSLTVNNDPKLTSESLPVIVAFQIPLPTPVPITKAPLFQQKPRENSTPVVFILSFNAPAETRVYSHFTITDKLHPALTLDLPNVQVTVPPNVNIPHVLTYDFATGALVINFDNNQLTAGKLITITLPTTLTDINKLPPNNLIENTAQLVFNNNPLIFSNSNIVQVRFGELGRCQAITDMVESVALEQAALSHILNAEGEKIQKAVSLPLTQNELISINNSACSLVKSISKLEMILQQKLELVNDRICDNCDK